MSIAQIFQGELSAARLSFIVRAGAGILAVLLLAVAVSRVVYPFDVGHQEAFSWMPAGHLLEGKNPYSFAFTPPYSMVPYGIVYYALLAVGVELFGLQLWFGRTLSVLGFAVCVWAVFRITEKLSGSRRAAWAAGLISLALVPAQAWSAIMRPDFVALAFVAAALWLVLTPEEDEPAGFARPLAASLLCVAAFFTKHTFLLPVGIIFLRFLQLHKWREAALFSGAFLLLAAGGMFFLNYTSGGGYVWQHFTHAQVLPYRAGQSVEGIWRMAAPLTHLAFAGGLSIFAYQNREIFAVKDRRVLVNLLKSPKTLILFYLFLSFAAATVSFGRYGANINYYLESACVMAITGGLIYADFERRAQTKLAAAMIVLMVFGGVFQLLRLARGEYYRWQARAYYQEITDTAAKFAPPGSVCFSLYVELVARGGCAFRFDDYGEYTNDWSPALNQIFASEVRAGRFAVVIWDKPVFHEQFPNYELVRMSQNEPERFYPVYLYVRKTEDSQ